MKKIMFSLILILFVNFCYSQNNLILKLIDNVPDYLSISTVNVSPPVYYEEIHDEYNAGYKYRLITISSGIYSAYFIDKISLDVEGIVKKQEWSRKIDFRKLYDEYLISEETNEVVFIQWINNTSFTFELSNLKFIAKLTSEENEFQITRIVD